MSTVPVVRIIDDDSHIHDALDFVLEGRGWEIRHYWSAEAFLAEDFLSDPGCAVVDVRMDGMSGLVLQRELRRRRIAVPVIFLTGHGTIDMAVDAMESGAVTFLTKPVHNDKLIRAIVRALEMFPQFSGAGSAEAARIAFLSLSDREREVVRLAASGLRNKDISLKLGIALRTVECHRANAFRKLGCRRAADAKILLQTIGAETDPDAGDAAADSSDAG